MLPSSSALSLLTPLSSSNAGYPWASCSPAPPLYVDPLAPPQTSKPFTPPRPVDQSAQSWLLVLLAPPGTIVFLVPLVHSALLCQAPLFLQLCLGPLPLWFLLSPRLHRLRLISPAPWLHPFHSSPRLCLGLQVRCVSSGLFCSTWVSTSTSTSTGPSPFSHPCFRLTFPLKLQHPPSFKFCGPAH